MLFGWSRRQMKSRQRRTRGEALSNRHARMLSFYSKEGDENHTHIKTGVSARQEKWH
jgi:hypothetical protein